VTELSKVVVVGASLAGVRAAETLRAQGFDGQLVIVGDEQQPPYDRPPLSKEMLLQKVQAEDIALRISDAVHAEWLLGQAATGLDVGARVITLADGGTVGFDGLVIATGSSPRRLPNLVPDRKSVFELRSLSDATHLRDRLIPGSRLIIAGSGFIGIEVASGARQLGLEVAMVSLDPPLAVAGALVSECVSGMLREADISLHLGRSVADHTVTEGTHGVILDDGTTLEADIVLVAVGAVPQIGWLAHSGLELGNGLICDETLHAAPNVVAAGDVACWPNPTFGGLPMRVEHWSNAIEQGAAAAKSLLHAADAVPFASVPSFWSDHFGVRLQSIGAVGLAEEFRISDGDPADRRFAAGAYRNGHLVGAIAYAMPRALIKHRSSLAAGVQRV